jgi:hypothetical protein
MWLQPNGRIIAGHENIAIGQFRDSTVLPADHNAVQSNYRLVFQSEDFTELVYTSTPLRWVFDVSNAFQSHKFDNLSRIPADFEGTA